MNKFLAQDQLHKGVAKTRTFAENNTICCCSSLPKKKWMDISGYGNIQREELAIMRVYTIKVHVTMNLGRR